jgi:hypothetical protein
VLRHVDQIFKGVEKAPVVCLPDLADIVIFGHSRSSGTPKRRPTRRSTETVHE